MSDGNGNAFSLLMYSDLTAVRAWLQPCQIVAQPQGLKPLRAVLETARLKSCPDTPLHLSRKCSKAGIKAASRIFLFLLLLCSQLSAQGLPQAAEQGLRLLDEGKPQEAIAYFEQALSANPTDLAALRGMGKALEWLGRFEQAVGYYRRAVEQAPADIPSWFALGKLQSWLGNRQAAYQAFETALALVPDNPEIELSYAEILSWDPQGREQSL